MHACAGSVLKMPANNSLVCYFPQGHLEHAQSRLANIQIMNPLPPPHVLSRVDSIKFMADPQTDEVFAKIRLIPINRNPSFDHPMEEDVDGSSHVLKRPLSYVKPLSESDANNGGGFSVPKQCALTIFPQLNYEDNPPVQFISCTDVHGEIWRFRHVYRGSPKRHLLTGDWSNFVNRKKLLAGDSIVFLKKECGDIRVGIRRKKGWVEPSNFMKIHGDNMPTSSMIKKESVIEAMRQASSGHAFDVVYYPRACTPEFCVKAELVRKAKEIAWCPGMRIRMAVESKDQLRINSFMGTIVAVGDEEQNQWPKSLWRQLKVRWEEVALLPDMKRINPWLVEPVSNMLFPLMDATFSPPTKKLCLRSSPSDDYLSSISSLIYNGQQFQSPLQFSMISGIQGSRQDDYSSDTASTQRRKPSFHLNDNDVGIDDRACALTVGVDHAAVTDATANKPSDAGKNSTSTLTTFMLFGQTIVIDAEEEQTPDRSSFTNDKTLSIVNHGSSSPGGGGDDDDRALLQTINFF